jgi:hypothetical protein
MPAARVERFVALALCAIATTAGAAQLDRLFHTPEERERLDRLRRGEPVAAATENVPARRKELTGFVKRSDGRGTAFIDGIAVPVDRNATPLLDPKSVRAYAGRESEDLKIERKPPR